MGTRLQGTSLARRSVASRLARADAPVALVFGAVLLMSVVAAVLSDRFLDPGNLTNVARQAVPLSLVVIGQTFVLLTGGIDFSVGAVAGLVAVVVAVLMAGAAENVPLGIGVGLALGIAIGLLTGLLVSRLHAMPFIVTFGVASIVSGVTLTISDRPTGGVPPEFLGIYDAAVGGLPVSVAATGALWFGAWYFLSYRRPGRHIYGIGSAPETARLAGIPVALITASVYVVSGLFSALAGLFLLARSGIGDPSFGSGFDFLSVTAAAIGGVSLMGGRGSVLGALGGVLLLTVVSNVFNLLQVDIFYRQVITGAIILIAVAAYRPRRSPLE
jgi:ribose transport system permease protein